MAREEQIWDDAATAAMVRRCDEKGVTREVLAGMSPAEQDRVLSAVGRDVRRRLGR